MRKGRGTGEIIGGEAPLAVGKLLVQVSQGQPLALQDAFGKLQTKYNLQRLKVLLDEEKVAGANSLASFTYRDREGTSRY